MKKIILLSLIFFALLKFSYSQEKPKIVKASGEAQVEWNKNSESLEQSKERAKALAIVNALESAFGVVVVQGNSTYIKNVNTGTKTETQTNFNMIGNSVVKGEVIEILKIKFHEINYDKKIDRKKIEFTDIKCIVTLNAKEITDSKLDIETKTLACTDKKCEATAYKDGDDFFVYFRSPVDGFLSIYLDDTKNTVRLLPYMEMPEGTANNFKIKADKEYILFSDKDEFDYFNDKYFVEDTYELFSEDVKDLNRVFIVFSKKTLNKPSLKKGLDLENYNDYLEKGYQAPLQTSSEDFQRWLIKNRSLRGDMQVEIIDITIEK